jgi:hypothetical protein
MVPTLVLKEITWPCVMPSRSAEAIAAAAPLHGGQPFIQ